jgi:hypothetical protein
MMKKFSLFLAIVLFLILILNVTAVDGFMPKATHREIFEQSTQNPIDSEVYRECMKYPSLCYSGAVLVDLSVLYYYTDPDKYVATHSPSFYRKLIENAKDEKELACAQGGGIHLTGDDISHNVMVPYAIQHTYIVNSMIHVFAEQKLDTWVMDTYPGVDDNAINDLGDYEQCKDLYERTMIGDAAYQKSGMTQTQIDALYNLFINEIRNSQKTGYDTAFKDKGIFVSIKAIPLGILIGVFSFTAMLVIIILLLIIMIIKGKGKFRHYLGLIIFVPITILIIYFIVSLIQGSAFNNFLNVISPVSKLVPIGDEQTIINTAIYSTKLFLNTGQNYLNGKDPSGFTNLEKADNSVIYFDYFIGFVMLIGFILFVYFLFKKNKINAGEIISL